MSADIPIACTLSSASTSPSNPAAGPCGWPSAGSRAEWVDKARKVEDLGYSALTVADHLAEIFGPIPAVVSAATATTRLRVGTNVLNNDFRHPVLVIGGNGPRLLTLAGQEADIVGLSGITFRRGGVERDLSGWRPAAVDERVELVRQAAGDRYEQLELNALVQRVIVTDARRHTAEELTSRWTELSAGEILQSPYVLVGTVDQLVDDLLARRARWGISSYTVFEPWMDAFAPVVARLTGR